MHEIKFAANFLKVSTTKLVSYSKCCSQWADTFQNINYRLDKTKVNNSN